MWAGLVKTSQGSASGAGSEGLVVVASIRVEKRVKLRGWVPGAIAAHQAASSVIWSELG